MRMCSEFMPHQRKGLKIIELWFMWMCTYDFVPYAWFSPERQSGTCIYSSKAMFIPHQTMEKAK